MVNYYLQDYMWYLWYSFVFDFYAYFEELQQTVWNISHLKHPEKLASSGFIVHGFITPDAYADKLLSPDVIPTTMSKRSPNYFL